MNLLKVGLQEYFKCQRKKSDKKVGTLKVEHIKVLQANIFKKKKKIIVVFFLSIKDDFYKLLKLGIYDKYYNIGPP